MRNLLIDTLSVTNNRFSSIQIDSNTENKDKSTNNESRLQTLVTELSK